MSGRKRQFNVRKSLRTYWDESEENKIAQNASRNTRTSAGRRVSCNQGSHDAELSRRGNEASRWTYTPAILQRRRSDAHFNKMTVATLHYFMFVSCILADLAKKGMTKLIAETRILQPGNDDPGRAAGGEHDQIMFVCAKTRR